MAVGSIASEADLKRFVEQVIANDPLAVLVRQIQGQPTGAGGGAETDPVAGPALATHAALTTSAHGGIVASTDPRLSDSRAPSGAAGGDLAGSSYPNPQIAPGVIVDADINSAAAIAKSKLASLAIVDADVSASAAIAEAKLALATDAAAGTGSRRTLGTSATSAAAGNRGLPAAGSAGQVLTKNTATDYDVLWQTPAAGTSAAALAGAYTPIVWGGGTIGASLAAGTYALWAGPHEAANTAVVALGTAGTLAAAFWMDPANWTVTGLTTKLRLEAFCHIGATAPGQTMTVGLYPVTTLTNTGLAAVGTVTAGSTVAFTTPAANSHAHNASTDINVPAAGWYCIGVNFTGATAASSNTLLGVNLQRRWV